MDRSLVVAYLLKRARREREFVNDADTPEGKEAARLAAEALERAARGGAVMDAKDQRDADDAILRKLTAPTSWAPEVIADNSGKWAGNGMRFATEEEAKGYVRDLARRWTLVRETRVVPSEEPVNYSWGPERLKEVR